MNRLARIAVILALLLMLAALLTLAAQAQSATPPPPQTPTVLAGKEFTLPIPTGADKDWQAFTGVGHALRYPPAWQAQPYQAQGGVRNSAMFQFLWTDPHGITVQVEALEIVNATDGAAVMETELGYWRQQAEQRDYRVEAVTVQGHPGWWIHATHPLDGMRLAGTLWADWGERVYRFRLRCRPAVCVESEQQLRQMLSTLQVVAVDWQRAPGPPPTLSSQIVPGEAMVVPDAPTAVTYNRGAAYAYASTYWNQKTNDDGYYLTSGSYDADGAHFVNRAVHAGGRPIPGLWDAAAVNVAGLRDWLQGDGWTTAPAAQAEVGDVAIMGPFSNPCWAGLVVATGTNPTLATHSNELWAAASTMYCNDSGSPTYVKTYLHANTEVITSHVYLPVVMRDWPPHKTKSGIHMGSRQDDWTPPGGPHDYLQKIDGRNPGSTWPKAVVVLSSLLYALDRRPSEQNPLCPIAQARVKLEGLYNYLTEAQRNGTIVLIRLYPSPGNFVDWRNPVLTHTLLSGVNPAGGNYCQSNSWPDPNRQFGYQYFRSIADLAEEMNEIYKLNVRNGWNPASFFFVPANEPNKEWYADWPEQEAKDLVRTPTAWLEMENYFTALYDHVHTNYPDVRVLTPPMAQGNYAERWRMTMGLEENCNPMTVTVGGLSGYDFMPGTYGGKNDGYTWNNYWRKDREAWENEINICPKNHHIFQYFPAEMQTRIRSSGKPTFITEADLFSPCQENGNPITSKQDQATDTADSLWQFVSQEQGANVACCGC
jgi:hypothetical protein